MKTYLPYPDFAESAYALSSTMLRRQLLDNYNLMQALFGVRAITSRRIFTGEYSDVHIGEDDDMVLTEPKFQTEPLPREEWTLEKRSYPRTDAIRQWEGHEWALLNFQKACAVDWMENLGLDDKLFDMTLWVYFNAYRGHNDLSNPPWLGDEDFHFNQRKLLVEIDPSTYSGLFPDVNPNYRSQHDGCS